METDARTTVWKLETNEERMNEAYPAEGGGKKNNRKPHPTDEDPNGEAHETTSPKVVEDVAPNGVDEDRESDEDPNGETHETTSPKVAEEVASNRGDENGESFEHPLLESMVTDQDSKENGGDARAEVQSDEKQIDESVTAPVSEEDINGDALRTLSERLSLSPARKEETSNLSEPKIDTSMAADLNAAPPILSNTEIHGSHAPSSTPTSLEANSSPSKKPSANILETSRPLEATSVQVSPLSKPMASPFRPPSPVSERRSSSPTVMRTPATRPSSPSSMMRHSSPSRSPIAPAGQQQAPSSAEKGEVSSRLKDLYEEAQRRSEKLKQLESQLPPEYTFSPSVNKMRSHQTVTSEVAPPEKRSEKLYEDAKLREERRRQAIEEASKRVDPEAKFIPQISSRAAKAVLPGGAIARSEKLYQDAQAMQSKRDALKQEAEKRAAAELTFKPNIQPLKKPIEPRRSASPTPRPASPSNVPVPAVVTRLLDSQTKRAERLLQLEKEREEREKATYTFAPKIAPMRSSSPRPRGTSGGLSSSVDVGTGGSAAEDKWTRLSKAGAKDMAALDLEKERLATKDCTFKPVIHATPPTSALVITAEKLDVHSRLYGDARTKLATLTTPGSVKRVPSPQLARPSMVSSATSIRGISSAPTSMSRRGTSSPVPMSSMGSSNSVTKPVAFGSSSASRLPNARDSAVVVPESAKDSAMVVPLDPRESMEVVPESPTENLSHAKAVASPARRSLSPLISARPASATNAAHKTVSSPVATSRATPTRPLSPGSSPSRPTAMKSISMERSAFSRPAAAPAAPRPHSPTLKATRPGSPTIRVHQRLPPSGSTPTKTDTLSAMAETKEDASSERKDSIDTVAMTTPTKKGGLPTTPVSAESVMAQRWKSEVADEDL